MKLFSHNLHPLWRPRVPCFRMVSWKTIFKYDFRIWYLMDKCILAGNQNLRATGPKDRLCSVMIWCNNAMYNYPFGIRAWPLARVGSVNEKLVFGNLVFHQLTIPKLFFCIPNAHYQWTIMPFGLKVAHSLFQKAMTKISVLSFIMLWFTLMISYYFPLTMRTTKNSFSISFILCRYMESCFLKRKAA